MGRLCTIQSSKTECYGEDGRFGSGVTALYQDSGGNLWAEAMTALWRWKPGPPKVYPMPDPASRVNARAIRNFGDELATRGSSVPTPTFSLAVEGHTRDLHPIVRDEIYRIAAEALRNAFRHAQAKHVEVEIHYDDGQLRLRVRDDGRGIDSGVLASQTREGHYGLRGMPERAALIGGKLAVWSEVSAGTEVELRVPGSAAYAAAPRRFSLSRFAAKIGLPTRDPS